MSSLYLFGAAFVTVFALGFQSLNVNQGHVKAAFFGSLVIGASNLVILKMIPGATAGLDLLAYLIGGPIGLVTSMWVHKKTLGRGK